MNYPKNLFVSFFCILISSLSFSQSEQSDAKEKVFYRNVKNTFYNEKEVDAEMKRLDSVAGTFGSVAVKEIGNKRYQGDSVVYTINFRMIPKSSLAEYKNKQVFVGKPLPSFTLKDLQGNRVSLADFKGKPLVINMWFTTCPPCIMEMPELNRIKASGEYDQVVFLAITFESKSKVNSFLKKNAFEFQHLVDAKAYCKQFTNSYPVNIFVNRDGTISEVTDGMPVAKIGSEKGEWKVFSDSFLRSLNGIK